MYYYMIWFKPTVPYFSLVVRNDFIFDELGYYYFSRLIFGPCAFCVDVHQGQKHPVI